MSSQHRISTDTAQGIFLAAAVGDALGWPQELRGGLLGGKRARDGAEQVPQFRDWVRNGGYRAHRYHDPVMAGQYSDDTQLLLAAARACLTGDRWWEQLTKVELPVWPLYQRGGGGAVLKATAAWAEGKPPWLRGRTKRDTDTLHRYRGAGANGVAMRIAPHVCWADDMATLHARVFRDGITTHGHPRALVGALVYASALNHAAHSTHTLEFGEIVEAGYRGLVDVDELLNLLPAPWPDIDEFAQAWQRTNSEMAQLLETAALSLRRGAVSRPAATLEELGCTDVKINGAGTITAAGALYLAARFASRPESALLSAAYLPNGDTDTLASMTGALLGAIHGTGWIPQSLADGVQDRDYLLSLAARSAARESNPAEHRHGNVAKYKNRLAQLSRHLDLGALHDFPDGRKASIRNVEPLGHANGTRIALRLDDGQSVLIDILEDGKPTAPRPAATVSVQSETSKAETLDATVSGKRAQSEESAPARSSAGGRFEAISLATRNLARCAGFYARLLDREYNLRDRSLVLTSWLRLIESDHASSDAQITLAVDDLHAAASRMSIDPPAAGQPLILFDPDERRVFVVADTRTEQRQA